MRGALDRWRPRLGALAESAALRAAWPIAWGALLASPRLGHWDAWPRLAAIGALVWALDSASAIHDEGSASGRDSDGAASPAPGRAGGGARSGAARPLAAGLAIASLLGAWPLLATVAAVAADRIAARRPGRSARRLRDGVRWGATAIGTWLALEGWTIGRAAATAYGAAGIDRALIVVGALLTLGGAAVIAAAAAAGPPGARAIRLAHVLGGAMLGAGLTIGQRPAALWVAALAAAALWPLWPVRSARLVVGRWVAIGVPALLAGVCVIDALLP